MNKKYDLINNPTPRLPCALVLDVSGSMMGDPIQELNRAVRQYLTEVKEDEYTAYSIEIAVILFGGKVMIPTGFRTAADVKLDDFFANGSTPMGEAVNTAIDMLDKRKDEYRQSGVSYFQPWVVLMTDGDANDDYLSAASRLKQLGDTKKATVFVVAIGDQVNMSKLGQFCPSDRPPLRLSGLKFKEFFAWLSQSQQGVTKSVPGEKIEPKDTSLWSF